MTKDLEATLRELGDEYRPVVERLRGAYAPAGRTHGAGAGRESAVRAIQNAGIQVSLIRDCTAVPHNGCRARKRRRV